ncbi:MAG: DNA repair helicase XPB [Chloroflexota bacterium]
MAGHSNPTGSMVVQTDGTLILETDHPSFELARDAVARFADLDKTLDGFWFYRISPLSLWNAAASGLGLSDVVSSLTAYSRYDLPVRLARYLAEHLSRYGQVQLTSLHGRLVLICPDSRLLEALTQHKRLRPLLAVRLDEHAWEIAPDERGPVKQVLVQLGYPAQDLVGYRAGAPLEVQLKKRTGSGAELALRSYQRSAIEAYLAIGEPAGGSGVVVLPCGAGKTVVGLGIMARLQCATLVLTTSNVAVQQWVRELLDKTSLVPGQVGEYTGHHKEVRPVTVTTYQILTHRRSTLEEEGYPHLGLFTGQKWGLIVYDEVHLLPAPVFRITAALQATRRLGLTATLVREDGRQAEVFSLIGPKRYDAPWKELERQGWIATAQCFEIRVDLAPGERLAYVAAGDRERVRLSAENPAKLPVVQKLLAQHRDDQVLIIGQYRRQLKGIARALAAPLITGSTPDERREDWYRRFRAGEAKLLVVSKVANLAIDLPDANVAIQVSGTFGSRQEEAQRLGRILRPKPGGGPARFYSIVTAFSRDLDFAAKRQLFLVERGYRYTVLDEHHLAAVLAAPDSG